ncbi:MAG: saccharopine dehydrogenase NADP-binding domain-containing protein, partial [Candidatus Dormibacteraeota bacterium]|nr:saccharopine dehydrogenase NADP-binding domain-containing protein [Candidatus Dormibacteraeota bacterium]
MPRRIVLYGASGYTGRLVAAELVKAQVRPVLAGPSFQNLAALGVHLGKGLDIAVADSRHPQSLLSMVRKDDVLVTTVGPFVTLGRPAAEAAIVAGASYIDCAAEAPFLRSVFDELSPHARDAGVVMLPAFGFLHVAGSLAAELALEGLDNVDRIDVGYLVRAASRRWRSVGITASTGAAMLLSHHAYRGGELIETPAGDVHRAFTVDGTTRFAVSI